MKGLTIAVIILAAGGLAGVAQEPDNNGRTMQGSAARGVQGQGGDTQARLSARGTIMRDRRQARGLVYDIAQGTVFEAPPRSYSRDPVQNPAVDLMTRRPRGVVLFSWNY